MDFLEIMATIKCFPTDYASGWCSMNNAEIAKAHKPIQKLYKFQQISLNVNQAIFRKVLTISMLVFVSVRFENQTLSGSKRCINETIGKDRHNC